MKKENSKSKIEVDFSKSTGLKPLPRNQPELPINPSIHSIFVDIVNLSGRTDGICSISFYSKIPGENVEVARVVMNLPLLEQLKKNIIEIEAAINNFKKPI